MATSNNAKRTKYKTADGLRIYDLEPMTLDIFAVAGPDWKDPRSIDCKDLPEGFRRITNDEWEKAIRVEKPDEFVLAHDDQQWLHSEMLHLFTRYVLRQCNATEEEINELWDEGFSGFEDLMPDLQCDLCHFLEDRGYIVILEDSRSEYLQGGPILSKPIAESGKMRLFQDAVQYAENANYPHYFERAGWVLKMLRTEKEEDQVAERPDLLDEAVDLLQRALQPCGGVPPIQQIAVFRELKTDIEKFLAKVAKN